MKLESPLLREQKRCVDPSDKSCIINQYKQTFMRIMDDLTRDRSRFTKPHLTVGFVYFTNIHLDSAFFLPSSLLFNIWISKRIEQILSKRYLVSWFVCPFTLSLHRVILLRDLHIRNETKQCQKVPSFFIWWDLLSPETRRAAQFWTRCSLSISCLSKPQYKLLQKSKKGMTKALTIILRWSLLSYFLDLPISRIASVACIALSSLSRLTPRL